MQEEAAVLGGGRKARSVDGRAAQPLGARAPDWHCPFKSLPQAATAAAAGGGEFI